MRLIKPPKLNPGDRVAAVSLSWGGPGLFPHRYAAGKSQLEREFGVHVVEARHALRHPDWLAKNPKARADDLMESFADPSIRAVISTIGGDESIRILPYLDLAVLRQNPKIFLGYSDSTITHFACMKAGLSSFYGPAIMAGFGENAGLFPYMVHSVRRTLFSSAPVGRIEPNPAGWTVERLGWTDPANQHRARKLHPPTPWRTLQGRGAITGHLVGGCIDSLESLKGTPWWPDLADFNNAVLFLETSEEAPPPATFKRWLRNYGAQGIFHRLAAVLFARPGGDKLSPADFDAYDAALIDIIAHELELPSLPILSRLDFGHTDPMFVLPYGAHATIDGDRTTLTLPDPAVI